MLTNLDGMANTNGPISKKKEWLCKWINKQNIWLQFSNRIPFYKEFLYIIN